MRHALHRIGKVILVAGLMAAGGGMVGCEMDKWLGDPTKTGRFEFEPTTIPILERIDVIEQEQNYWANAAPPTADDLIPSELSYTLYPGDTVTLGIFELYQPSIWFNKTSRVDAGGYYRIPEIGDIRAAGLTAQQFEDEVKRQLSGRVFAAGVTPQVDVMVEQGGGLRYTVNGYVRNEGQFTLQNPDLRLVEALANAGGVPQTTSNIYIIRRIYLSDEPKPVFNQPGDVRNGDKPGPQTAPNVEDLINQLDRDKKKPAVSPGMLQDDNGKSPPVDINQLEPVRVQLEPPVDVDTLKKKPRPPEDGSGDTFIYVEEKGEWVRVPGKKGADNPPAAGTQPEGQRSLMTARIISIDYKALVHGDTSQNVVVRPNDVIYVDGPEQGLVYIEGEIVRPGVYQMPTQGGTLTLSRLVASAGGLGGLAEPTRVDLTRKVGPYREATIRLDLAAIRQRTEPDVVIRADDHIIIGTSFMATPMAVIRNGFRATYGFGFLLDRNFGGDVFGAEPGSSSN